MNRTKEEDGTADSDVLSELVAIKKLLVLALTEGVEGKRSQLEIAKTLGIGQASVSRMLSPPEKKVRKRRK